MKKLQQLLFGILTCALCFGLSTNAEAQNNYDTVTHFNIKGQFEHFQYTSGNPNACNYGYVFGHSCYEYKGFAEKFTFSDSVKIEGLFAYVVHGWGEDSIASTKSVNFRIYTDSSDFPDSILGSESVNIQDLKINAPTGISSRRYDNFAYQEFSNDIGVKGSVFASFELPDYRNNKNSPKSHLDTLGLRTSKDQSVNVTNRLKGPGGSWFLQPTDLSEINNGVYFYLVPVINTSTGMPTGNEPFAKTGALGLNGSYPNPVKADFNLDFSLDQQADVAITVFSSTGKRVHHKALSGLSAGKHHVELNLSGLNPGNYIYMIKTGKGMLSGKIVKE